MYCAICGKEYDELICDECFEALGIKTEEEKKRKRNTLALLLGLN